jgi:hypothetical protein
MSLTLAIFRAIWRLLTRSRVASFSPDLSGQAWERRCDDCQQRQINLGSGWGCAGAVRNRVCSCRFIGGRGEAA